MANGKKAGKAAAPGALEGDEAGAVPPLTTSFTEHALWGINSCHPHLFYLVNPRPSPHSGIFDGRGQSKLALRKGDSSVDGVVEC